MVVRGRIENGVVVLQEGVHLPEGMEVSVLAYQAAEASTDKMTDEERERIKAIFDRLDSLPNENPGDTFGGANHDKVLYGEP